MFIPFRLLTGIGLAITASFTGWQGLRSTETPNVAVVPVSQASCSTSIDCGAGEICVLCVEPCDLDCTEACDLDCIGPCDAECLEQCDTECREQCELPCDSVQTCAEQSSCSQSQACSK